jgi:hypothetical protein
MIGCAANRPTSPIYQTSTSKDTWDRYQPVSLNELKTTLFDFPDGHVGMTVNAHAAVKPYRIEGIFLSEQRPMPPVRTELIRKWWGVMFKIGDQFTRLFEKELLFEVEGTQYWMPVQNQVIPYFQNELTTGDKIDLYVMVVGTIDKEDQHEWIIIVNEFQKKR